MQMTTRKILLTVALLIWAGACIGANMIAAPAKFQVADLTLPVALQVGRVQFHWVSYLEMTLAALAALTCIAASHRVQFLVGSAIAIFFVQKIGILPHLSLRTDQVIAGQHTGGSHLHIYFIVSEMIKILILTSGAYLAIQSLNKGV